ncbi:hypothetical protein [Pandoraea sputorum]|uniref:hypothetical protein n=1 Tax=Pandoraea sputorum TaxID=93222 RepID=UPI00123FE28C|nr:hypothetical protein [Pandoraea sputorum]VVE06773.1 hypothetical protein PSP20601_02434 [Pandoraea sputorum]
MKNPKLSKLAAAMPFAHFLGLPRSSAARAADDDEDDDRKQRDGESDEDYAKRMEEQDKKDEARKAEEEKEREDARRAEGDDDDADAEEDEKEDKEDGKRAGRAKGARQRERVRCAAIVAEGLKLGMVSQACAFAFDTSMTASQAVNALHMGAQDRGATATKPRGLSLDERMAHARPANPGATAPAAAAPSLAEQIIAAGKQRRGEI